MNFQETLNYMYERLPMYQRVGNTAFKKDLGNIQILCERLGNPQEAFQSVHIAGTNGKGSSSHMLAAILQSAGYTTGLYTSPHLRSFTERVKVDGQEIEEEFVIHFIEELRDIIEEIQPSFFEITVALAFAYFQSKKVEVAVIEVGLGGRFDSTNIIQPLACLITNISFDHVDMLGDTLEKIAFEKAGIIKPGVPVVVSQRQAGVDQVFQQKSEEVNAALSFASDALQVVPSEKGKITVVHKEQPNREFMPSLLGKHQHLNICGVLQMIEVLNTQGRLKIPEGAVKTGIESSQQLTGIKGRWQQLGEAPYIFCDIGHNEEGLATVVEQISRYPYDQLHIVLGMVKDKEVGKLLQLLPQKARYYFCKPQVPRGLDAGILYEKALHIGLRGELAKSVAEAINKAKAAASPRDFIFIGGSTFVVAEVEGL
ncbi:folylpolyglutamate synthase/dihydrofolate synthase family protein [Rapidithrix thailandica]|uniref:Dihydrofolate synthase/folylpolyglutamate synthase n=1 Tax=Rapidithrix thailandica TaxID=413964 RepID=A0AAW9S9K9_9BACT